METYENFSGTSNVEYFEIGREYIKVKFYRTNKIYTYSYDSAGVNNVEQMKKLARQGYGLNSYIMKYARYLYE